MEPRKKMIFPGQPGLGTMSIVTLLILRSSTNQQIILYSVR